MNWSYRIGTKTTKNPWYGMDGPEGEQKEVRTFHIIKCFTENPTKPPYNWAMATMTEGENVNDIRFQVQMMNQMLNDSIIDLDNFPNEYNGETEDYKL